MKHVHEFRDPIHTAISVCTDELNVIDSQPFQRLRHIHQLALTYLVFPGATHKRFEHSIGVMELASRIFDVVTNVANVLDDNVRKVIPNEDSKRYWKSVLRMAALCHDLGHLPFSHAAEELLPDGYDHERMTKDIIYSQNMRDIWAATTPPLRTDDIVRLAVGGKLVDTAKLSPWEMILTEIITGDAFGADRMDYLLRDAYHVGIQCATFDHLRLINALRILPAEYNCTDNLTLGLEASGLKAAEGLMIARHFMYKQVYFQSTRRIYDIHLRDFLKSWLPGGRFSIKLRNHLQMSDAEVLSAIRKADSNVKSPHHELARRIQRREHFRALYDSSLIDKEDGKFVPGEALAEAAEKQFGKDAIRYDHIPAVVPASEFPVWQYDGKIESSLKLSQTLARMPRIRIDRIYCNKCVYADASRWRETKQLI